MKGTVLAVLVTFAAMWVAWRFSRHRWLHATLMGGMMLFDVVFPFYLYFVNDWYKRLIEQEQIFSFSVWMHVGIMVVLYTLYVVQVQAGLAIWRGDGEARGGHRLQAKGILAARVMALLTGVLLMVQ
jgi:hypothetical protein